MNLKKMEKYLRVNLLGPGPRLMKKNLPGRGLTKVDYHCSTCFESKGSSSGRQLYIKLWYGTFYKHQYRGADKSLARPGRKQARKHVRDARDFNNIDTRAVIKFIFPCKARRRRKFTPF